MEKWRKLVTGLDESNLLKSDLLPSLPIVEICDKERVLIENHRGVIRYGCNNICVKVRYGLVCINGSQLQICRMSKNKLVVTGKIHGVALQGREEKNVD